MQERERCSHVSLKVAMTTLFCETRRVGRLQPYMECLGPEHCWHPSGRTAGGISYERPISKDQILLYIYARLNIGQQSQGSATPES